MNLLSRIFTVKFEVTEEHIKNGKRSDSHMCPVSLALKDRFPEFTKVVVGYSIIYLYIEGSPYASHYVCPNTRLKTFIADFDRGMSVKPSRYDVRIYKMGKDE